MKSMTRKGHIVGWALLAYLGFAGGAWTEELPRRHEGEGAAFSAQSRLILVPLNVLDRNGANVLDLQPDHFKVFDESEERPVVSFAREEAPVVMGLVVDSSGSMAHTMSHALEAVRTITNAAGADDLGFLMTFADRPALRADVTHNLDLLSQAHQFDAPRGGTAMRDAVYEALLKLRAFRRERKALIVISDGGDNASRYTEGELVSLAKEADTQIYSIFLQDTSRYWYQRGPSEVRQGFYMLEDLAKMTGGLQFLVRDRGTLPQIAERVATAMKNSYVIGYKPTDNITMGKWRNIRIVLSGSGKNRRVYAKTGYYAQ